MQDFFRELIYPNIPQSFFRSASEEFDAAFARAHQSQVSVAKLASRSDRRNLLGQHRHVEVQNAIRKLSLSPDCLPVTFQVGPSKYEIPAIAFGGLVTTGVVSPFFNHVRPSKFRKSFAERNAHLRPQQQSLFPQQQANLLPPRTSPLSSILIAVRPRKSEPQGVTSNVFFGIPNGDLDGWHFLSPLNEIHTMYATMQHAARRTSGRVALRALPRSAEAE